MIDQQIVPTLFAQALTIAYRDLAVVELVMARRIPPPKSCSARPVICIRANASRSSVRRGALTARIFTMTYQLDQPLILSPALLSGRVLGGIKPAFMGDMPGVALSMRSRSIPEQRHHNGVASVSAWWGVVASLTD